MHSSSTEKHIRSPRSEKYTDQTTSQQSSSRRLCRFRAMPSGFISICLIYLFSCVFCMTTTAALPTLHQHITDSSTAEHQLLRNRRALDTLDGDDFSLRKRALDTLDGDDFTLKRKRALDLMEGDGFSFEKRALDSLDGEGFSGFRKRALDSLEGDGFNGFNKRALDMLEGDDFAGFNKRALDALEGNGFDLKRKRALDALDGNGFGLDKRTPAKSQHESRLRRAIDQLNRVRAQALAERLKRSVYGLRLQSTVKRALDALEGNDSFGF